MEVLFAEGIVTSLIVLVFNPLKSTAAGTLVRDESG